MRPKNLGESFVAWAEAQPHILVLLLIGSRARKRGDAGTADGNSDWDFQVVTSERSRFLESTWMIEAGLEKPFAYVAREGRLGGGLKVSIVAEGGELDIVVISAWEFRMLVLLYRTGLVKFSIRALQGLRSLNLVWRGGVVVLKGSKGALHFVHRACCNASRVGLDNDAIAELAEGFVCDYVSVRRKLERGEVVAAQRWLHLQLGEVNLALFHELRQREGAISFPDARRMEFVLSADEIKGIAIDAALSKKEITRALYKSTITFNVLMQKLLLGHWHWPQLPSSLRVEELRDDVL